MNFGMPLDEAMQTQRAIRRLRTDPVSDELVLEILKRLPPYSGIRLSTRVTFAANETRVRARDEPIKPSPPVMRTTLPS